MSQQSSSENVEDYDNVPLARRVGRGKRRRSPSPEYANPDTESSGDDEATTASRVMEIDVYHSTPILGAAKFGPHPQSVFTRKLLDRFGALYNFLEGLRTLVPRADTSPEVVPNGYLCVYALYFKECGLRFPIPYQLLDFLSSVGICFPQACPSLLRAAMGTFARSVEIGEPIQGPDLSWFYNVKKNPKGAGTYYLPARPSRKIVDDLPNKDTRKLDQYFFVEICPASIGCFPPSQLVSEWRESLGGNTGSAF